MLTAIFVYQPTYLDIRTCEKDLQLCGMASSAVALTEGQNGRSLVQGVYKIVSSQNVEVTGDNTAFGISIVNNKTNGPTIPTLAGEVLGPLDPSALQAFFVEADAKKLANP